MRVLATGRVGDGGAPIVAAGSSRSGRAPAISCSVAPGTLVILTDTVTTQGCPGRPDSEDALLGSADAWLRTAGWDLPCVATQVGFDSGGRPRLVLAVCGDGVERVGGAQGSWGAADHSAVDDSAADDDVEVQTLPCTVVTFTGVDGDDVAVGGYDVEAALLRAVRSWVRANPDVACEAVQMAHDPTGRPQAVLVGAGFTAQAGECAHRPTGRQRGRAPAGRRTAQSPGASSPARTRA